MNKPADTTPVAQRSSAPAFPHLVIRASAGSGKTFQLSNRYLGLLSAGAAPDQILATTFTRKAAGEILDRILLRLARAATDETQRRELVSTANDTTLSRTKCLHLLRQTTRHLHRLQIGTLDSFFAKIASSFSLEFGLPPGWRITDELNDAALRDEAIEAVLNQDSVRDLLTLVHLLTKGEATRGVSELVRATVDQLYELYRETSAEAWQKIPHFTPLSEAELEATIEDLRTVELPGDKRFATARDKDFQNAIVHDWETFIEKGLANKVLQGDAVYYRKPIPPHAVAVYEKLLDHAKAVLVGQLASQTEATYKLLQKFDVEYQRLKHERRALRFDDVTHSLVDNALTDDMRRLAFRLDGGISHLLLDEFQDTSLAQWQVLRPFARQVTRESRKTSFFCVGDVKQAIYGWRGGIAEIFDALTHELTGLTHHGLSKSFRSSPPVIETVNRIFQNFDQHPHLERLAEPVRRWCEKFATHSTAKNDLPGYVRLQTAPLATEDQKPQDAVLLYTAEKISQLVHRAPKHGIGVLVRKNATVGKLIYLLRKLDIDASEEGGNPLTDSAAVELILSLLRLADHPGDTVARFHLATSPLGKPFGLEDHRDHQTAETLAREIRRQLLCEGYGPVIFRWAQQLASSCDRRELNRLQQLIELAYSYQEQATLRCDDFVAMIENQRVSDPSSAKVRVMTVHQAKGLEFDVVVLPELDVPLVGQRGWFVAGRPSPTQPIESVCRDTNENVRAMLPASIQKMFDDAGQQSLAEALCVLYVAVTRPAQALYIIVAPSKATKGKSKLPKTFAGLLRAALTDGGPLAEKTIAYECGDRDWLQPGSDASSPVDKASPQPTKPPTIQLAPSDENRRRGLESSSPSGLEGGNRVQLADIFQTSDNREAMLRGTLIHAWFEQIEWLDDGLPDVTQLRRTADEILREHPDHNLNVEDQLTQFHAMLDAPTTAHLLSHAAYKEPRIEVHNERRFTVRDGNQLLTGSIDRLVLLYNNAHLLAADIIDFKTDALPDDDAAAALSEKVAFYRPQLEAYRRAVAKMTGLAKQNISARLLFVAADELARV